MKRKIVVVKSHGPLSFSKTIEIGWEDVWLRLHFGRHSLKLAPCLVSREHLRFDIAIAEKIANDPRAGTRQEHKKEAEDLRTLLEKVDALGHVVDHAPKSVWRGKNPGHDFAFANVFTRNSWIDRAEAECMLDSYLSALGVRNAAYKWKGSRFMVWPTTLDADAIVASDAA